MEEELKMNLVPNPDPRHNPMDPGLDTCCPPSSKTQSPEQLGLGETPGWIKKLVHEAAFAAGFNEYQKKATTTHLTHDVVTFDRLMCLGLGLCGEAGEVAEKVKKIYRDNGRLDAVPTDEQKAALNKELGDVLWYLAVMADGLGLNLADIAASNLEKLRLRAEQGKISGSGDNR